MKASRGMWVASVLSQIVLAGSALAADSPGKLRSEMAKVERQYIDLYNKVNANPEFAMLCRQEKPTGTSFSVRVCQPRYVTSAKAKAASERMSAAVAAGNTTGGANVSGPNVGTGFGVSGGEDLMVDKDAAFRQNILELQQKNPELQALGKKRDELQARLDEASRGKSDR